MTTRYDVRVNYRPNENQVITYLSDMGAGKVRNLMNKMGQASLESAPQCLDGILEVIARKVAAHTRSNNTGYKINEANFEIAFKCPNTDRGVGEMLARDIREYLSLSCFGLDVQQPEVTRG